MDDDAYKNRPASGPTRPQNRPAHQPVIEPENRRFKAWTGLIFLIEKL
jgi:hypothetical protein